MLSGLWHLDQQQEDAAAGRDCVVWEGMGHPCGAVDYPSPGSSWTQVCCILQSKIDGLCSSPGGDLMVFGAPD